MERQRIFLLDWEWLCSVYYDAGRDDAGEVLRELRRIGCCGDDYRRARRSLTRAVPNEGQTYSDFKSRQSVVVVGRTTSAAQFQDTFDHEKGHLCKHICLALGIDPFGEEAEYLAGAIGRQMFPVARKYLCDHCRKRK